MKVLLTDNVNKIATEILGCEGIGSDIVPTQTPGRLGDVLRTYDAVIVRSATKLPGDLLRSLGNLKAIGRAGAGVDNIDLEAAREMGIAVFNSPAGNVNAVAEHTMALMLSLARNVHTAHQHVKGGGWEKKLFKGVELRGKKLGVIGLGKIGRLVAAAASGLGMEVIGYDPYLSDADASAMGIEKAEMDTLLAASDFVTVHVPLTDATRGLLGSREFSMMKDGVRVLNVARGGIIDECALYDAMKSGKVAGAAIDVWESEPPCGSRLLELDNVLATPHLGGSTAEAQVNVAEDVARNIAAFLCNGKCDSRCRVA